MSSITIDKNNIPLKAYLRADPFSQHFYYKDSYEELVNAETFWGKGKSGSLYLDYSKIVNHSIQVSQGINFNRSIHTLKNKECDDWINNNIQNNSSSNLLIIQGYAGCGKTTFVNFLINNENEHKKSVQYINVGQSWDYLSEPKLFFTSTLSSLDKLINSIVSKTKKRERIWSKFIEFGLDTHISCFVPELSNIFPMLKKIKDESSWKDLMSNIHANLNEKYGNTISYGKSVWQSIGQTNIILSLIFLLTCADEMVENENIQSNTYQIIFDDIDIITNPAIPSENIVLLWGLIDRYIFFKNNYYHNFPNFEIIITVRKYLHSHIVSHLPDLEMEIGYNIDNVCVCDISELYSSKCIISHRIKYWNDRNINENFDQINDILSIDGDDTSYNNSNNDNDVIKESINLDAFLNHNYRAFANLLSNILGESNLLKILIKDFGRHSTSQNWQKVSTLVYVISLFYKGAGIWNNMGFGCKNFSSLDYPTTLNRLILNYLYLSKQGQFLKEYETISHSIPSDNYVSLEKLIEIFSKLKFIKINNEQNNSQIEKEYNNSCNENTKSLLIERLANMCSRQALSISEVAYGYNSEDDELWRRPLFFIGGVKLNHTAASNSELKNYFDIAINNGKSASILFSITDEGEFLIKNIVSNFEFYSARYCDASKTIPLHHASTEEEIDSLVQPVYNAVKKCCERNVFILNKYVDENNVVIDSYLKLYFHPRTKPRFEKNNGQLYMAGHSFRPQLHIVRVIYEHIAYFDKTKEMFSKSGDNKKICCCLTSWIEKYLKLYKSYFYDLLNNTICNSDNNVYNDLYNLVQKQKKRYSKGDGTNVIIGVNNKKVVT